MTKKRLNFTKLVDAETKKELTFFGKGYDERYADGGDADSLTPEILARIAKSQSSKSRHKKQTI